MRYAKAGVLAEMPTKAVTNQDLDLLDVLVGRLQQGQDAKPSGYSVMNVGEPVAGHQMVMRMKPEVIVGPETVQQAEDFMVRSTPGQLQTALDAGASQMASTDFGWVPVGADASSPLTRIHYGAPTNPDNAAAARQQGLGGKIKAQMPELMDQFGLKPGDLVYNSPVGTNNGDYTRAVNYVRSGFGSPSFDNEQYAIVNNRGGYEPWQPFGGHPGVGQRLGWDVPLTPEQKYQWEQRLANQMARRSR